jgi:hypothetical protein
MPGGSISGANFREIVKDELRRIPLPGTSVNKGKKKCRSITPALSISLKRRFLIRPLSSSGA